LFNIDDGSNDMYQDHTIVEQAVKAEALDRVPERGSEGSNTIRKFEPEEIAAAEAAGYSGVNKIGFNPVGLYVEDAIPQNNAPYTEGPEYPPAPADGDYHRMIYVGLSKDVPARLYRWSQTKGRWIYLETDRRAQYNEQRAVLTEYLTSDTKKSARDIK
jgi:hypothetical protein